MGVYYETTGGKAGKMRLIVNATSDEVELFLHGVVGESSDSADAKSLATVLAKNPGKPVTVRINSPGGSFYDGLAIANALRRHDAETTAIVDGLCASAATVVATGCDKILMYANSSWHVHESLMGVFGHVAEIDDAARWLRAANTHLAEVYANRTGKSVAEIRKVILGPAGDGTHFDAREALAYGWVDAIVPASKGKPGRYRQAAQTNGPAAYKVAALRLRLAKAKANTGLMACGR